MTRWLADKVRGLLWFVTLSPCHLVTLSLLLCGFLFFLVTVVLSTAVAGRAGNLAPLAIGITLTFNILMGGALTGAPFNPARALGPMIATGRWDDMWLYLLAPTVGAIVAASVHKTLGRLTEDGESMKVGGRVPAPRSEAQSS